jgi:hypothetical protein
MRTKKKVDFKRLVAALADYPFGYLITVDDDYRVHTVTVEPTVREVPESADGYAALLDVGLIGGRNRANLAQRRDVTLLWPPREPGGYSLIVDGHAEVSEEGADSVRCAVVPTRALLHRDADAPSAAKGCLHDCVVFSQPA